MLCASAAFPVVGGGGLVAHGSGGIATARWLCSGPGSRPRSRWLSSRPRARQFSKLPEPTFRSVLLKSVGLTLAVFIVTPPDLESKGENAAAPEDRVPAQVSTEAGAEGGPVVEPVVSRSADT